MLIRIKIGRRFGEVDDFPNVIARQMLEDGRGELPDAPVQAEVNVEPTPARKKKR